MDGRQIGRVVENAIKGMAFSHNLEELRNNVDITIREVQDLAKAGQTPAQKAEPFYPPASSKPEGPYSGTVTNRPASKRPSLSDPRFGKRSNVPGMLMLVFGTFLSAFFLFDCIVAFIMTLSIDPLMAAPTAVFGVLGILSLVMAICGGRSQARFKRFKRYCSFLGDAAFCSLQHLADATRQKLSFTKKDISQMIAMGWFSNGHLDRQESTLMLDEETYRQYLLAEDARIRRETEEAKKAVPYTSGNPELDEAVKEGKVYIQEIRRANDRIPGEEISRKISRLETITAKIFACVERRPEKLPDIRRFMSYYLPTTLKLLNAYAEFDSQPVQSAKISSAKEEISSTLDTISQAFSNLLDSLYEEDILDISSDISVLEAMFAQEGLTGEPPFSRDSSQKQK